MPLAPATYYSGGGLLPAYGPGSTPRRQSVKLPASIQYPKGTILGEAAGANQVTTVTIGGATGGTFTLTVLGQTTAAIAYNATAAQVAAALNALSALADNAVQTVTITGTPTGGTFTLTYQGQTTAAIAYNATAAVVQAALALLPNLGANVTCTGGALPGTAVTVTFTGALAGVQAGTLVVGNVLFTGGSTPAVAVAVVNPGGGGPSVAVTGAAIGPYVVTFQGIQGSKPLTLTGSGASLTGSPAFAIANTTTGVLGTPGLFTQYLASNTDGSQVPKCILEYDVSTDANSLVTMTQTVGATQWGTAQPATPAFFEGTFFCADLEGLDATCVAPGPWRLISGNLETGIISLN